MVPIDILASFGEAADKYRKVGGLPKWINAVGTGKVGKTRFLVDMMEHLRIAYIDCDPFQGTKPYTGTFFVCNTYKEIQDRITWLEYNKEALKIDILVMDNLDGLFEKITDHVCKEYNVKDYYDLKINGVGNGYSVAYAEFKETVSRMLAIPKLFYSICHIKDVRMGVSEVVSQIKTTLDLPAGLQVWTQKATDTNLWFSLTTDEEHPEPYVRITQDPADPMVTFVGGSRNFPGLFNIKNEFQLKDYLITNFKGEE
jgi:hypothetical protein